MSQANMSGKTANMTATAVVRPLVLDHDRRTMIISDIHGNLPFLKGLLRKVGYTKDDVLIILGDILEKSVHGLETLRYLMELSRTNTVYFVQGNCEDVTLSFLRGSWPDEVCLRYGSMWGDKCAWVSMAHQVGMEIQDPKHYPAGHREALPGGAGIFAGHAADLGQRRLSARPRRRAAGDGLRASQRPQLHEKR